MNDRNFESLFPVEREITSIAEESNLDSSFIVRRSRLPTIAKLVKEDSNVDVPTERKSSSQINLKPK